MPQSGPTCPKLWGPLGSRRGWMLLAACALLRPARSSSHAVEQGAWGRGAHPPLACSMRACIKHCASMQRLTLTAFQLQFRLSAAHAHGQHSQHSHKTADPLVRADHALGIAGVQALVVYRCTLGVRLELLQMPTKPCLVLSVKPCLCILNVKPCLPADSDYRTCGTAWPADVSGARLLPREGWC